MSDTSGSGGTTKLTVVPSAVLEKARDDQQLANYWKYGEGAAKVRWHQPGAWTRCFRHMSDPKKGLTQDQAKRMCAQWLHDVTGRWPGQVGSSNAGRSRRRR